MYPRQPSPWTDPTMDERLRALWGVKSVIQIGKELGLSKNSIVGRAHRLKLPRQTNPIKRQGDAPPIRPYRERKEAFARVRDRKARIPRPPVVQSMPVVVSPVHKCQWITTNDRPWLFCLDPVIEGRPYCPTHCRQAYVMEKAA